MPGLILTALLLTLSAPPSGGSLLLGSHTSPGSPDSSHRQMQCIMQQLQLPHQVLTMPWRRARQEVKQGRIDGYFTAIPSTEMAEHAVLSAPLFLENWYWFWHTRHPGPFGGGKLRYGVILGSHQADWLQAQGLRPEVEVNDIAQLVQLLNIGRIDSFIADLEDFNTARARLKLEPQQFQQRFFRYVPLGVYFSQQRIQHRPGFLQHFNAAVHLCASSPFALSATEQHQILDLMLDNLLALARLPQLINAVQQQNQTGLTPAVIAQRDSQWQQQLQRQNDVPELAQTMLQNSTSVLLRGWQANYNGLITEVILMDNQGANVAISELTSDYWQGDETPFLSVFAQSNGHFIDVVEYDQSTQRFQVKLSVPVTDYSGQHIGALSIGIDVEHALTAAD